MSKSENLKNRAVIGGFISESSVQRIRIKACQPTFERGLGKKQQLEMILSLIMSCAKQFERSQNLSEARILAQQGFKRNKGLSAAVI